MPSKTYQNDGNEGRPTTIATGVSWLLDPANESGGGRKDYMHRHMPFNSLFIANEDTNEIHVYPNGNKDKRIVLSQGATRNYFDEPFRFIQIYNAGAGTVAASKITVRVERIYKKAT